MENGRPSEPGTSAAPEQNYDFGRELDLHREYVSYLKEHSEHPRFMQGPAMNFEEWKALPPTDLSNPPIVL